MRQRMAQLLWLFRTDYPKKPLDVYITSMWEAFGLQQLDLAEALHDRAYARWGELYEREVRESWNFNDANWSSRPNPMSLGWVAEMAEEDTGCGQCAGSGEGRYDGSRCSCCRGSGDIRGWAPFRRKW